MKMLVVGAAGGVGHALVEQAVARGHDVTAFVRDASNYRRTEIRVVVGDARDLRKMSEAVAGQDAVVNAIGEGPWTPTGTRATPGRGTTTTGRLPSESDRYRFIDCVLSLRTTLIRGTKTSYSFTSDGYWATTS